MNDDGGPAFPNPRVTDSSDIVTQWETMGMSLRNYFAAHAPPLPAFVRDAFVGVSPQQFKDGKREYDISQLAEVTAHWNFLYADAMLKEREK